MTTIPLLSSSPTYSEASQIIPTINGVIQSINANALIGSVAPTSARNLVIGGDFSTNPWQRGTSFAAIASTITYTADRFWALGGASSSIAVSQQAETGLPGFSQILRFQRTASNTDTAAIKLGQAFTSIRSYYLQGQPFVLSFYAKAGATYSAASNVLGLTVGYGTGTNESAANFASGGWTGYTAVTLTGSAGTTVTGVTLTTSYQRFSVAGFIPATATQVGFNFSITPVGTAGATDYVQIAGVQLERVPQGGLNPTPFENTDGGLVNLECQRYYSQINEPAANVLIHGYGYASSTSAAVIALALPVVMRATPTVTFPAAIGSWVLRSSLGTQTTTITMTSNLGGISSTMLTLTASSSATTLNAGSPAALAAAGSTTNPIKISAEL